MTTQNFKVNTGSHKVLKKQVQTPLTVIISTRFP